MKISKPLEIHLEYQQRMMAWLLFADLKKIKYVLEIGGGYGQLCAGLINSRACNRYYIVDFPEILNVVNRWISTLELGIEIYNYTDINFSDKNLYKSGLHLIPNRLLPMLTSAMNVDLLINNLNQNKDYIMRKFEANLFILSEVTDNLKILMKKNILVDLLLELIKKEIG
jgi:hypothetical protein